MYYSTFQTLLSIVLSKAPEGSYLCKSSQKIDSSKNKSNLQYTKPKLRQRTWRSPEILKFLLKYTIYLQSKAEEFRIQTLREFRNCCFLLFKETRLLNNTLTFGWKDQQVSIMHACLPAQSLILSYRWRYVQFFHGKVKTIVNVCSAGHRTGRQKKNKVNIWLKQNHEQQAPGHGADMTDVWYFINKRKLDISEMVKFSGLFIYLLTFTFFYIWFAEGGTVA